MSSRESLPYTVIGGYLGAGKTTLLNNLLRNADGLRLAVLINDFGDINIDAELIEHQDGETISLANGCICCSLADGFLLALNKLRERADAIDHVVVEASGVSDPVRIGQFGAILGYERAGVIVLADAADVREKATNKYVGELVQRQFQGADLVVLNKCDLVPQAARVELLAWLGQLAPNARLLESSNGQIPLDVLLGVYRDPSRIADDADSMDHATAYERWSFVSSEPLERKRLEHWLSELPDGILRAKGVVNLLDSPRERTVLQCVGRRCNLTPGAAWGDEQPATRLVFIGARESMSRSAFEEQIAALTR